MDMVKIDTHVHTKYSSPCGQLDAQQIVDGYLKAGYDGIVITDHFHADVLRCLTSHMPLAKDKVQRYLEGYYRVKEEGLRKGLKVYRGAELRFEGSFSDYLLYGYHDELMERTSEIFSMGLEKFISLSRADGALLIQAHPYRPGCQIADHRFLDGVEVLNKHPGHNSQNELALAYAEKWPALIRTSGSDCHELHHIGRGGIIAEALPEDETALVKLLRSGEYSLIG